MIGIQIGMWLTHINNEQIHLTADQAYAITQIIKDGRMEKEKQDAKISTLRDQIVENTKTLHDHILTDRTDAELIAEAIRIYESKKK